MAERIDAFWPANEVKARVDKVARELRQSRRHAGVEALYPPGGLEAELQRRYGQDGIPLNDETLNGVTGAAEKLGISVSLV